MQDVMYFNNYRALMDKALGPATADIERQLGRRPRDVLNSPDRMPFYGFFKTKDGKVAIVSITTRQWKELTEIIGHPEMATDPRFENMIAQIHNHEEAVRLIEEWTSARTSREVIAVLEGKKIPCGSAHTLEEVNRDENLKRRGMFQQVHHELYGDIDIPGLPFKLSAPEGGIRIPAPGLGEHSRMILEQWLGYTADEIDKLYKQGAII